MFCASAVYSSNVRYLQNSGIAILTGGLSDGGKIGIGVGIGVGGMLVLGGILFIVLCRRYEWIKRTKTGILRILLRPYFCTCL